MPEQAEVVMTLAETEAIHQRIEQANELIRQAHELMPWKDPVGCVQWIPIHLVQANDYNPNAVAFQEMRLLYVSISEDGYTQPVVAIWDEEIKRYVIVDGFHRWTVMKRFADVHQRRAGYLPVVVLDKTIAERMASTIRHNRARGRHSVAGMGNLVFQLLMAGEGDDDICNKLGMEAEELARLKHITGYSKLYADLEYGTPVLTTAQIKAKAAYKKEHPDEVVPSNF